MSETEIQERPFPTTGKPESAFLVGIAEQNDNGSAREYLAELE